MTRLAPLHLALGIGAVLALGAGAASAATPTQRQQIQALSKALESGAISEAEYDAKVEAIAEGRDPAAAAPRPQVPRPQAAPAAAPAAAAVQGSFQTIADAGGGHIITGALGRQPSAQAAMAAMLRRAHAEFGSRPTVTRVVDDAAGHGITLFFDASRNGAALSGMALVSAPPGGEADGALLFDSAAHFAASAPALLRRVQGGAPQAAAAPAKVQPLRHMEFGDGSGSVDIPEDWMVVMQGGGSFAALGPHGEGIVFNGILGGIDPGNPQARFMIPGALPGLNVRLPPGQAVVPFMQDPVAGWIELNRQIALQHGNTPTRITVKTAMPLANPLNGYATATAVFAAVAADTYGPRTVLATFTRTPELQTGAWSIQNQLLITVPDTVFAAETPTIAAMVKSFRTNPGVINAQTQAILAQGERSFESLLANGRAQDAARAQQTQGVLARDAAAQEGMHRQAVAMENYSLDRSVVENTATGARGTLANDYADALVKSDSGRYRTVPANEFLRGVDY